MEKQQAVIYGLGKRFIDHYFTYNIFPIIEKMYIVRGVSDKQRPKVCPKIGEGYIEIDLINESDIVIVTSDIFYNEIKLELLGRGIKRIISIDDIECDYIKKRIPIDLFKNLSGVEIGGPSRIFLSIYQVIKACDGINFCEKTIWWNKVLDEYSYKELSLGKVKIADATDLSLIEDNTYDFYVSSNNLEHIANPIKALFEAKRILNEGGLIFLVVPNKEMTFDHNRNITSINHIINDYKKNISESDLYHIDEIMSLHDFEMDTGVSSSDEFKERALKNYSNRCLHHHVFDEKLLIELFEYLRFSVISSGNLFDNYYILGRV